MKTIITNLLRLLCLSLLVGMAVMPANGQQGNARLQLTNLERLVDKASETVHVNIDERILRLALKALNPKDPEEAAAIDVVSGLKGIYVRSLSFETEGVYTPADLQAIRQQLRDPDWSQIVGVVSKKGGNNVDVYLATDGERIDGLAVLSFEPKRLTVVNIVGSIDLEKLRKIEGKFGIPELELGRESKSQPKK